MSPAARAFGTNDVLLARTCIEVLRVRGVFAYRQNQCTFQPRGRNERDVRGTIDGVSDIIGVMPGGRFLVVECTRPGNVPTKDQRAFLDAVARRGGLAIVISDAADLADIIDRELGR